MASKVAEIGLASRGRLRIIRELSLTGKPLSTYMIEKKTGIRRKAVASDLNALMSINWVKEIAGRIKKYELNPESGEVMVIIKALHDINYIE
ncbi:MAG: hypothetical protein ACP5NC_04495 [Nitrososphaeria archaeon]